MKRRSKTVYSYDVFNRYVGTTLAYETWDLAEPPIWMIPARASEKQPLPFDPKTENAVFDETTQDWNIVEKNTPENTPRPEFDSLYFEIKWNLHEEKWDLIKLLPSPENTPRPEYDINTHEISWDRQTQNWKLIELPSPENTPRPSFDEYKTEENYNIIWDTEKRFWKFVRKINWNYVRELRNQKLTESDWALMSDANPKPTKEAWLEYRQNLRDLPQNFSHPEEVSWPLPPQ